jgi:hypothetical protein
VSADAEQLQLGAVNQDVLRAVHPGAVPEQYTHIKGTPA